MVDDHEHFFVEESGPTLNLGHEEERQNPHQPLLALRISDGPALLHLLVQITLNILLRKLDGLDDLRKDLEAVGAELDVDQRVVVLLDLVRVRHAYEEFLRDCQVVSDQIG